jgi:ribosomal protein S18 acetylase RimI-like enzyme
MTSIYRVRLAEAGDLPAIYDLIGSAVAWLQEGKDTDQWARPWPDKPARDARVEKGIADGLTWMVEDAKGSAAATVTCREHGNAMLWTAEEQDEPSAYVSRLIVSRQHAGLGLGAALIDWAGLLAMNRWQARWIRVDVWTTNLALHRYYKGQGFEHLRTLEFDDPWDYPSAALFQKPTADVDAEAAAQFEMPEGGEAASEVF